MARPPVYQPTFHAWRQQPAEYLPDLTPLGLRDGWYQNGVRRKKFKPYYHLVWPKDKDRGAIGRMKDILQGKGPDIHLTISAQKNDYMYNRQRKSQWSNWQELNPFSPPTRHTFKGPCWVRNGKVFGRDDAKKYNFYTRKYEDEHPYMWTDAVWQGPNKKDQWADQWRDVDGFWYEDQWWNPYAPGQTMKNAG